ncbi:hypothetical protein MMC26_007301 [Xylographa opegraphella]|nr:hypothetical protein [Xylographa opegraphella]
MSVFSDDFDCLTSEELLEAELQCNIRAPSHSIPHLPDEVLFMIFQSLKKNSLKQVRLVCRRWSRLPIGLLFTRVYLSHYTKDLEVFSRITSHPEMSSSITELVFCTSHFNKDISLDSYVHQLLAHPFAVHAMTDPDTIVSSEDRKMSDFILNMQRHNAKTKPQKAKVLAVVLRGHEAYKKVGEEQARNRKNGEATIRFYSETQIVVCAQRELITFISSHPLLRRLWLQGIELTEGDWASTFSGLRRHSELEDFVLDWPLFQPRNVEVWSKWSRTGQLVRYQLMTYVVHGGDNPLIDSAGDPIHVVEEVYENSDDDSTVPTQTSSA